MLATLRSGWLWMGPAILGSALAMAAPPGAAAGPTAASPAQVQAAVPGTITTIGGGLGGPGLGTAVGVNPCAVTYAGGSLYVTDFIFDVISQRMPSAVRQIDATTGNLRTLAGDGADSTVNPFGGANRATESGFGDACGIAVDHAGNVLVSDGVSFSDGAGDGGGVGIRVIAHSVGRFYGETMYRGDIYTLPNTATDRVMPGALAIDGAGNVLFISTDNKIYAFANKSGTFYGVKMTAGQRFLIAGGGTSRRDGVPALKAAFSFADNSGHANGPFVTGLRIDHQGNVVIADPGDELIRVLAARTGTFYGMAMRPDHVYTIAGHGVGSFRNGGLATRTAIGSTAGLAVDHSGNIVISSFDPVVARRSWSAILVLAVRSGRFYGQSMTAGHIYRIAGSSAKSPGDGGPALKAAFVAPFGVSVDGNGNVVVADRGSLRVIAVRTGTFYGRRMRAEFIYRIAGTRQPVFSGDGGPARSAEMTVNQVNAPVAVDGSGDVLIANGSELRFVPAASATLFGRPMRAGFVYRIAGTLFVGSRGDGGPATNARLGGPEGIAADAAGNAVIADTGNFRVRVIAARTGSFYGRQMTAGDIYTVAGDGQPAESGDGGPAVNAGIGEPVAVAVGTAGDLVISTVLNTGLSTTCEVRIVAGASGQRYGLQMTAGDIYTIAGGSACQTSGDGGPARSAGLYRPGALVVDSAGNIVVKAGGVRVIAAKSGTFYGQQMTAGDIYSAVEPAETQWTGLAVDGSGNLLVTEPTQNAVLVVAESTGTFYGQPMTAGNTYQIAGNGFAGHGGDGGPATSASLLSPDGIALTKTGDIILSQYHWISKITG